MSRTAKLTLIILSALLSSLPFSFPSLSFLPLVSLSVFFYIISLEQSAKKSFFYTLLFAFVYYLGVHYYFISLYPLDFAGLSNAASVAVVLVGWWGISAFHALFIALAAFVYKKLFHRETLLSPFALASLFTIFEFLQSLGFLGFPWGHLYLTQSGFLPFIQSSSLFGPYFITFLIVLINALLANFYKSRNKLFLYVAFLVFSLNLSYGIFSLATPATFSKTLSASVVQPSIVSGEKWSGKSGLDLLLELSDTDEKTSLIIWPETAIPSNLLDSEQKVDKIYSLIEKTDASVITGAFFEEEDRIYNAAVFFDREGVQLYFKQHLVPFGEYVPLRPVIETLLPFLSDINMLSYDLTGGTQSTVFDTAEGKVGALVCFDSIFTSLARDSVKNGAEVLSIITNDSWYKTSRALYHHNAQAVFRAVENHRSVIRCANSGISSFIDPCGRILYMSEPDERVIHTQTIQLSGRKTLYTVTGNVFLYICFVFLLICVFKKKKQT